MWVRRCRPHTAWALLVASFGPFEPSSVKTVPALAPRRQGRKRAVAVIEACAPAAALRQCVRDCGSRIPYENTVWKRFPRAVRPNILAATGRSSPDDEGETEMHGRTADELTLPSEPSGRGGGSSRLRGTQPGYPG